MPREPAPACEGVRVMTQPPDTELIAGELYQLADQLDGLADELDRLDKLLGAPPRSLLPSLFERDDWLFIAQCLLWLADRDGHGPDTRIRKLGNHLMKLSGQE
jgi:hypothetical protein